MKYFELTRVLATIDGTIGRMGRWYTMEEEGLGNQRNISSILPGAYVCRRIKSPNFGETFMVEGVPDRDGILFHPLNTEEDTRGCIGLGLDVGFLRVEDEDTGKKTRKLAIRSSREAQKQFMRQLVGLEQFILIIKDFR